MRYQRGVTLSGMLMSCVFLLLLVALAFKIVPVYIEYAAIQRQMKSMAEDPTLKAVRRGELDRAWAARATVDNIKSLPPENIDYQKEGDRWIISGSYSVKVPLFRNVSACFDFEPSSKQ